MEIVEVVPPAEWLNAWQGRIAEWCEGLGAGRLAHQWSRGWAEATDRVLAVIEGVGHIAVCVPRAPGREVPTASVVDIWVAPEHRGQGNGRRLREFADAWSRQRTPRYGANLWGDDPGVRALYASYPARHQRMFKPVTVEPTIAATATARPMTEADYPGWLAREIPGYADDISGAELMSPQEAMAVSAQAYQDLLPDGIRTPGNDWSVIEADGEVVATIWIGHDWSADASFVYAVEVVPEHRGKGYGRAAMLAGEAMTLRVGHRYLGLNVFGHNQIAIGLYESLGYRVVDQTRIVFS